VSPERDRPGSHRGAAAMPSPAEPLERTTPLPPSTAGLGRDGATLDLGEVVAGRFGIVRFIARGGMGAVYEAEDTTLRTRVAIKTILPEFASDPTAMERFRREVLLARRITHYNVCRIFELYDGVERRGERISFLTMELLHGETLAERLARTGPLATAELAVLLRQLADGLEAMHLQDVVHRDFKPANVFLVHRHDAAGHAPLRAVITDFGIARALHRADRDGDSSMTARMGIIGTPAYMAPEQLTGGTVSAATDIYALGIVLYEALTGHPPFAGTTPMEAALKRLQQAPPPPSTALPSLDPRWDAAILRCLEKEPPARFRSVRDLVRALDATAHDPRASVAVLGFRNLAARPDAAWLSTALGEMLGRELSQAASVLRLVPQEEVFRAQRALNLSAQDSLPRESLQKLRDSAGARWVVLGSYLCVGPGSSSPLRLAVRAQDAESGQVVCHWSDRGTVGELGAMASRAGAELRRVLAEA
jgi:eukaryotic-like serine/threonine-protein kinase